MGKLATTFVCSMVSVVLLGQGIPRWADSRGREADYPGAVYFTGFAMDNVQSKETLAEATVRIETEAQGALSKNIRVKVEETVQVSAGSLRADHRYSEYEEFLKKTQTTSDVELVGVKIESYYDKKTKLLYAFAYADKRELVTYHAATLAADVEQIQSLLKTAALLEQQYDKIKARRQYEDAAALWGKTANTQDLLRALGGSHAGGLPQTTWMALREEIIQALLRTEISVFVDTCEDIFGQPSAIIANKLKAQLAKNGYRFTDEEQAADYTLHIHATARKIGDPRGVIVFCEADVTVAWRNNCTRQTVYQNEQTYKGGSTTWERAGRKAMEAAAEMDVMMWNP